MANIESNKGEIVMYQPDETVRLEVRMGEETVWLTQQQMAELFDTDRSSITKHINNIYETEELTEDPTCAKIAQVRKDIWSQPEGCWQETLCIHTDERNLGSGITKPDKITVTMCT